MTFCPFPLPRPHSVDCTLSNNAPAAQCIHSPPPLAHDTGSIVCQAAAGLLKATRLKVAWRCMICSDALCALTLNRPPFKTNQTNSRPSQPGAHDTLSEIQWWDFICWKRRQAQCFLLAASWTAELRAQRVTLCIKAVNVHSAFCCPHLFTPVSVTLWWALAFYLSFILSFILVSWPRAKRGVTFVCFSSISRSLFNHTPVGCLIPCLYYSVWFTTTAKWIHE